MYFHSIIIRWCIFIVIQKFFLSFIHRRIVAFASVACTLSSSEEMVVVVLVPTVKEKKKNAIHWVYSNGVSFSLFSLISKGNDYIQNPHLRDKEGIYEGNSVSCR